MATSVVINSPAVVFAVLHGITLFAFATKALAEPTSVVLFLVLFGAIRVAELGMEVVVNDSNLGTPQIFVASGALWDAGIFALLYSAYMLVLKRGIISGNVVSNRVTRITSNPRLFRLILATGVVFGISAWTCDFPAINNNDGDLGDIASTLELVCVTVFLFATVLLAVQTVFLLSAERASSSDQESTPGERSRAAYAKYIPSLIAVLLLIRGMYQMITICLTVSQPNIVGYLVGDLPEWLAVALFVVKGLIPPKKSVVPPAPESEKESVLAPTEGGSGVHESSSV